MPTLAPVTRASVIHPFRGKLVAPGSTSHGFKGVVVPRRTTCPLGGRKFFKVVPFREELSFRLGPLYSAATLSRSFSISSGRYNTATGTYYATTPVYYVNAAPHLGHLYTSVIVDTLVRFHRQLKGRETLLATGTDEHGLKVHHAALASGATPQAFCDRMSGEFRRLAEAAGVSVDHWAFVRTSSPRHAAAVKVVWEKLVDNGLIYLDRYEGWYAVADEAFYAPRGEREHFASATGSRVQWTSEPTYRFRLSKFSGPLLAWLEENPETIQPPPRRCEVLRISRSRGLARASLGGSPYPGDDTHVIYVWVDALCNYLTAAGYPEASHLSRFYPADLHVVGKDILRFHAIYWPAIPMGAGLPLPKRVLAHGHWTSHGAKMSKTKGNGVEPLSLLRRYGEDAVRYYLLRDGGNPSDDHDFAEPRLQEKYRKELMGTIGNLASRLTSRSLNPHSTAPNYPVGRLHPSSRKLYESVKQASPLYADSFASYQFGKALDGVVNLLFQVNQYLQQQEPWKPAQRGENEGKAPCSEFRLAPGGGDFAAAGDASQDGAHLSQLNVHPTERTLRFAEPGRGWKHPQQAYHPVSGEPIIGSPTPGGLFPKLPA
ncbi:methionyl-tRNA synthetase [Massospora cicadina]|nr:methionyl-tRNA synthetase [Massospora cicadina]